MLGKLIPALLALFGLAAGAGAGLYLRPSDPHHEAATTEGSDGEADPHAKADTHEKADAHGGDAASEKDAGAAHGADPHAEEATDGHSKPAEKGEKAAHDYVKMNNQFVVPIVQDGRVSALVILSISLEITAGESEKVFKVEPKLRDGFLQVMFDHANAGGFMGTFTDGSNMVLLREALLEVAQSTLGPDLSDVLIVDIIRQDN